MAAPTYGTLADADLTAATNTELYKPGAGRKSIGAVNLCNRTNAEIAVRFAKVPGGIANLANGKYRWYDLPCPANGYVEKTGVICAAGEAIVVRCASTGISASYDGIEEDV